MRHLHAVEQMARACGRAIDALQPAISVVALLVVGSFLATRSVAVADEPPATPRRVPVSLTDPARDDYVGERKRLRGRCRSLSDKPLAGAVVKLYDFTSGAPQTLQLGETTTTAEGEFEFDLDAVRLPSSAEGNEYLLITVELAGYAKEMSFLRYFDIDSQKPRFVLVPGASLTGRVTDREGKPVAGATVSAVSSREVDVRRKFFSARTDEKGRYILEGLKPYKTSPGEPIKPSRKIYVDADGYVPREELYADVPGSVDVSLDRAAVVHGTALIGKRGQPAAGVQIRITDLQDRFRAQSTECQTDKDGAFRLSSLKPGSYSLVADLDGYPQIKRPFNLREGDNPLELRFQLGGTIRGRMIDAATGEGVQLPENLLFRVTSQLDREGDTQLPRFVSTVEPNGTFSLCVPAGLHRFSFDFGQAHWEIVNLRQLSLDGFEVKMGEEVNVEVKVRPSTVEIPQPSKEVPVRAPLKR